MRDYTELIENIRKVAFEQTSKEELLDLCAELNAIIKLQRIIMSSPIPNTLNEKEAFTINEIAVMLGMRRERIENLCTSNVFNWHADPQGVIVIEFDELFAWWRERWGI